MNVTDFDCETTFNQILILMVFELLIQTFRPDVTSSILILTGQSWLLSGYLVIASGYLIITTGYFSWLLVTSGKFLLLLVPRFGNNAIYSYILFM